MSAGGAELNSAVPNMWEIQHYNPLLNTIMVVLVSLVSILGYNIIIINKTIVDIS